MNDFREYSNYLEHYGVKGMHWGIRRYQPYPSGKNGRFLGSTKAKQGPRKGTNPRKIAYVAKHKEKILNSSMLTKKYYDYLTPEEIEKAKKKARDKQELFRRTIEAYKRPAEVAAVITGAVIAAAGVANVIDPSLSQTIRHKITPILKNVSAKTISSFKPSVSVVNEINSIPIFKADNPLFRRAINTQNLNKLLVLI